MIIVSTNGDPVEIALDSWAAIFEQWLRSASGVAGANGATLHLRSPHSVASRVQQELQNNPGRIFFFFGHGTPASFKAADGNPVITANNASLLSSRVVSATCCDGQNIGGLAPRYQFSVLGHAGILWIPTQPNHVQEMEQCVLEGPRGIAQGGSVPNVQPLVVNKYAQMAQDLFDRDQSGDRAFSAFASMNAGSVTAW